MDPQPNMLDIGITCLLYNIAIGWGSCAEGQEMLLARQTFQ